MKKFKKILTAALSATLVIGMIPISSVPAQAAAPKFNVTSKSIALGKKYTLKVSNAKSGSTFKWKSSKPEVASVSSSGKVTALKTGKATVACTVTYPNKKTKKKLTAKITVTEAAVAVSITGITKGRSIGVGKKIYTYGTKTRTASKGTTTDKVYWYLGDNTAGATITSKGVVTTKQPGSFTIQAKTAATKAKSQKGIFTAVSKVYTVEVPFELSSKLTAINKVTLNTNYAIPNLTASDIVITEKESGKEIAVQGLDISDDGLTVVATTKTQFVSERKYEVTIPQFEKADSFSSPIGDIHSIEIPNQTILPDTSSFIDYTVYDEYGIDLTQNYPWKEFETNTSSSVTLTSDGQITLPSDGDSVSLTMTYSSGSTKITSNKATITAKKATIQSMAEWTIVGANDVPDWNNPVHTIAVSETGHKLYIRFKDNSGNYVDTYTLAGSTTFSTADANTLSINNSGVLTPYQAGTVKISYTTQSYSNSVSVKVVQTKTVGSLSASAKSVILSNDTSLGDYATLTFTLKDSDGNAMVPDTKTSPTASVTDGSENVVCVDTGSSYTRPVTKSTVAVTTGTINTSSFQVKFKPYTTTGTSTVTVTYNGVSASVSITVRAPGTKAGYAISLDNTILNPNDAKTNSTAMYVYEVDNDGVKRALVSSSKNKYTILDSKGNTILSETSINLDGNNDGDTINATQLDLPDGVYTVIAYIGNETAQATFSVETTVTATNFKVLKQALDVKYSDDVYTRILECVEIYVGNQLVNTSMNSCTFYAEQVNSASSSIYANNYITKGSKTFGTPGTTVQYRITQVTFTYAGNYYTIDTDKTITFTTSTT